MSKYKRISEDDNKELQRLNKAVADAVKARTKWLDENMDKYAPFKVGEKIFNLKSGGEVGTVVEILRYKRGDAIYDNDFNCYAVYHLPYDKNSRLDADIATHGNRDELVAKLQKNLEMLKQDKAPLHGADFTEE